MPTQVAEQLEYGVYCIDAHYMKPGLVSFYLVQGGGKYAVIDTGTAHSVSTLEEAMRQLDISPQQISSVASWREIFGKLIARNLCPVNTGFGPRPLPLLKTRSLTRIPILAHLNYAAARV